MSSVALLLNIFFGCFITSIFLYRCGNYRRQHPITTGAVFIAWSFSVLIVFLLPLDISLVKTLSFVIRLRSISFRLPTKNVDRTERSVKIRISRPWNRVRNRGRTSIRSPTKFSGESSTGHPNFSLGTDLSIESRVKGAKLVLGLFCRLCSRFAKQV